jgi:desulfoferrodoxin (superoxide reductase-like protein)
MNTQAEQEDNTEDVAVIEDEVTDQPEEQSEGEQAKTQDESDSDEVVVSIGEEAPPPEEPAHAPEWVRELRKTNRELQRQNRELQTKLQTTHTENKPVVLGPKPKLEDHDYDAEKYEEALTGWFERKRQADEVNAKQEAEVMNQQKAWQAKLDGYGKAKAELKVKDFEDAEAVAQELFNVTQQGVMLQGADNPALVVYALGKNPKKAQELASIKDPVKFAFAVAKLEKDLKVTNRKAAPPPERVVTGTGRVSGAVDSTLERLRDEAARTGNMTKVIQYKAQRKAASSK